LDTQRHHGRHQLVGVGEAALGAPAIPGHEDQPSGIGARFELDLDASAVARIRS
jgi:hypothetical protein